jgi:hypothetical protein
MDWGDYANTFEAAKTYQPLALDAIPQIRAQAAAVLRRVTPDGTGFRAHCPLHVSDDAESTTLRVNLDPSSKLGIGFWKCYSCLRKGHWNELAEAVGIDSITGDSNPEIKNLLMPVKVTRNQYVVPENLRPWPTGVPWRRKNKDGSITLISAYAFGVLEAQLWDYDFKIEQPVTINGRSYAKGDFVHEKRAWLPILNNSNQPVAHVGALLNDRYPGCKKYLNDYGPWAKKNIAFVQQAQKIQSDRIVLVEGPADAARLIDNNIPASPLLGVGTWTSLKSEILASMYSMAIVCLDGDSAGQPAQAAVAASLGEVMSTHTVSMPNKQDPASLPDHLFKQFINTILTKR